MHITNPRKPEVIIKGFFECKRNVIPLSLILLGVVYIIYAFNNKWTYDIFTAGETLCVCGAVLGVIFNRLLSPPIKVVENEEQKDTN